MKIKSRKRAALSRARKMHRIENALRFHQRKANRLKFKLSVMRLDMTLGEGNNDRKS